MSSLFNFTQIYKCHMARSLCCNALYRFHPTRNLFNIQLQPIQVNSPYCIKHLKLDCPSSQYLSGVYSSESQFKSDHISYCSSTSTDNQSVKSAPLHQPGLDLPSAEQLISIGEKLDIFIQKMFVSSGDIPINGKTIVYINNLNGKNKIYKGVLNYTIQKLLLRLYVHFKFMSVNMEVTDGIIVEEDGTITCHWKLSYISNTSIKKFYHKKRTDIHGTCIATVKNDGLIHSLYLERRKVMDSEPATVTEQNKQ